MDHIIFRNEDNGYTVMVVIAEEEELTCVGSFQYLSEGETIKPMDITQSTRPMADSSPSLPMRP